MGAKKQRFAREKSMDYRGRQAHKRCFVCWYSVCHLFKSGDEGESWEEVTGLFNAPNRKNWGIDWGYGTTGLTIHTIKSDPFIKDRLFIVASGNGVYRSDDSGENWKQLKRGVASKCPVADEIGAPDTPKDYSIVQKSI